MRRRHGEAAAPLEGIRVLDFSRVLSGPHCSRMLADLGADVIKVEPPGAGDPVRRWGARYKGDSAWWSVHGRNKRRVTLDLKKPRARELALGLAARCDALVLRPGIVPHIQQDPGAIRWAGPAVGAHNEKVMGGLLGLSGDELAALRKEGVR